MPGTTGHAVRNTQYGITKRQFILESGRGERLWQAGRAGEAVGVFRALLARLDAGAAYDTEEVGYDRTMTLQQIGRCLRTQGQPVDAAAQYRAALEGAAALAQTDHVRRQTGACHTDLADVLTDMGQYAAARAEYEAALALDRELGDERGAAVDLGQLGTLALAQGDLAEARRRYLEVLALFRGMGEAQMEAVAWHQLGVVAEEARDWAEAERCHKEALRIREQIRDLPGLAKTCNQLAIVAKGAGRPAEAERWYRRAIELMEALGAQRELAAATNNLADLLLAQGRLDEAEGYAQRARAIVETLDLSAQPWATYSILAQIAERRGQVAAARGWRRKEQETRLAFEVQSGAGRAITSSPDVLAQAEKWNDVAEGVVAVVQGNSAVLAAIEPVLDQLGQTADWRSLVTALRRILQGEHGFELFDGLDDVDSAVVRRILARLAGEPHPPAPAPDEGEGAAAAEPAPAPEEGLTLPQLLDLVERAARGDQQLGSQLFDAMRQLASDPGQPAELRGLGKALTLVLIGDKNPDLAALPPELASAVRGLLGRLRAG